MDLGNECPQRDPGSLGQSPPEAIGVASYGEPGHVPPSTSSNNFYQLTSEPHKVYNCQLYLYRFENVWNWSPGPDGETNDATFNPLSGREKGIPLPSAPGFVPTPLILGIITQLSGVPNFWGQFCTPQFWHCVRGLISPATANELTIDVLFYFVTFSAQCASVSMYNKWMNEWMNEWVHPQTVEPEIFDRGVRWSVAFLPIPIILCWST